MNVIAWEYDKSIDKPCRNGILKMEWKNWLVVNLGWKEWMLEQAS
jgi:hypothetical protein